MEGVGYSNEAARRLRRADDVVGGLVLPVPNGLSTEHAALTEPMAVGVHAVAKARLEPYDAPLVIGCGPVGLAVIAALKLQGRRADRGGGLLADAPRARAAHGRARRRRPGRSDPRWRRSSKPPTCGRR